jgi:hypothetical protein
MVVVASGSACRRAVRLAGGGEVVRFDAQAFCSALLFMAGFVGLIAWAVFGVWAAYCLFGNDNDLQVSHRIAGLIIVPLWIAISWGVIKGIDQKLKIDPKLKAIEATRPQGERNEHD